jgi:hypothetical protein
MCLWYVQYCEDCGIYTPIPDWEPNICSKDNCCRKNLNPLDLTPDQKREFLGGDTPCMNCWPADLCGLWVRFNCCGQMHSVRGFCPSDQSDDEFDDLNIPDDLVEQYFLGATSQ